MFILLFVAGSSEEDPGFFEKLYTYVINNIQVGYQHHSGPSCSKITMSLVNILL